MSLPLYAALQQAEGLSLREKFDLLRQRVTAAQLARDIDIVIYVDQMGISLDYRSLFGKEVLAELKERSTFPPCPPGDCEMKNGSCVWCGAVIAKKEDG